ncbi:MAG: DUF4129 domain-containing protein, partial [Micromonosporaceae bacterium]
VEPLRDAPSPDDAANTPKEADDRGDADSAPLPALSGNRGLLWLGVLGLVLIVGLVVVLLWRTLGDRVTLRRTEARGSAATQSREQVRAAVAASIDELAADGSDPRSAVIGCWLRLERAAATAGTRRTPSDTPGELIARMLAEHEVSGPVLDRFAEVYRQARYAPHDVAEAMRDEARAALQRLHADLSRGTPAHDGEAVPS